MRGVNWIIVVQKKDQWRASVNTETHLRLFYFIFMVPCILTLY